MEAIISNKALIIKNPSPEVANSVRKLLSYKDKSKEYLLRRRMKMPFFKGTPEYFQLINEINGSLYKDMNGHIVMPSGFAYLCNDFNIPITHDTRASTGKTIAFPWVKKPFDPRDYQEEAIQLMENNWRGVINFATGLGKTLTAIHAIRRIRKKTLVVVPSESIALQFYEEMVDCFGKKNVGFYSGKKKKIENITVGIANSVVRNLDKFDDLGLIIFDEVHHIAATTFFDIAKALGDCGKIFGLTATDFRSDGKDIMITAGCGDVLIRRDLKWGIEHQWLAKPRIFFKNVGTIGRNYRDDKLKNYRAHVLHNDYMKDIIDQDIQNAINNGKSVLILVDQVEHGEHIAKKFGIPFATGTDKNSQSYVDQLNAGSIPGLVGTDGKVGEGTDTKRVDVLILANFTGSLGPVTQCVGRGARLYGNKTHIDIHDYKPLGSDMLARHADNRFKFYETLTDEIQVKDV